MVGEIDTKPIEPVQNAIYLFGDREKDKGDDQKKHQPTRKNKRHCEKEIEELRKELANCKVQLEAKHAAHMQALLKLEHNQKKIHELSSLLKNSDLERNKYKNECNEGRARKEEIESKLKEIDEQNLKAARIRDQLSHVLNELKANQRELLNKETELVAARDSEQNALANSERLRSELEAEKEQKEELLNQVKELNEVIQRSKRDAIEAEKLKLGMLFEKDEQIELATKANAKAQQKLEDMRNQIEDMDKFHNDMEVKERKIMDQSSHIETLEMELNDAKEEINGLNVTIESLTIELEKAREEVNMNNERDIQAQVEIALLTSQLQEHRLVYMNGHHRPSKETEEASQNGESKNNEHVITLSMEDYKCLVREAEKANEVKGSLKKELESASVKIAELRARAEQALSRAELAEKAKAVLEDKIARHREQRQRRKASIVALREESTPKQFSPTSSSQVTSTPSQPLGKVLNLKL